MKAEKILDKTYSQDLYTSSSPLDLTGFKGDKYDYEFIIRATNGGANQDLYMQLNSDTGSNYRRYYMKGASTTANAGVTDTGTYISLTNPTVATDTFLKFNLTGSSGDERYIDMLIGSSTNSTIIKTGAYWKNTASEFTSVKFFNIYSAVTDLHIIIYRTPKVASQSKWELMETKSWSSSTSTQSFTVDGDSDIKYRLEVDNDQFWSIRLNNDSGSNYIKQDLYNGSGSIASANATQTSIELYGLRRTLEINAETGVKRLITASDCNKAISPQQYERAIWYTNTATNLTSIDIIGGTSATGTAKLYRAINPATTADTLPFETIETVAVSGDFSAGHTFTVSGSDDLALYKIEWIGDNTTTTTDLRVQFNSDTGSNYSSQSLTSLSSSVLANSTSDTYVDIDNNFQTQDVTSATWYIYPKSGENRPMLNKISCKEISNYVHSVSGSWWLNSADPITSIKVFASSSASITGTLKLSRLK